MYLEVDKSTEEQVLIVGLILNPSVLDFNGNLPFLLPLKSEDDLTPPTKRYQTRYLIHLILNLCVN